MVWANGVWADGVWATGVWEEEAVEETIYIRKKIVGRTSSGLMGWI